MVDAITLCSTNVYTTVLLGDVLRRQHKLSSTICPVSVHSLPVEAFHMVNDHGDNDAYIGSRKHHIVKLQVPQHQLPGDMEEAEMRSDRVG
jgi:hypothetical protein